MNKEKDPITLAGEEQCRKFGSFLSDLKFTKTNKPKILTKSNFSVIKVNYASANCENISLFKLLESDNKLLSKVLLVFGVLKKETSFLDEEAKKIQQILIFLDDELNNLGGTDDQKLNHEEYNNLVMVKFSANLEHFVKLKFLVQKLIFVANHYVQQLSALFLNDKFVNVQLTNCFPAILEDLGCLLYNLLIFDNILSHSNFKNQLKIYKKSLQSSPLDENSKFSEDLLRCLSNTINELELLLLDGSLLDLAFDNIRNLRASMKQKVLATLSNYFMSHIKNLFQIVSKFEDKNLSELYDTKIILELNIYCVLYHIFCCTLDQKLFKTLMEINNKYCGITLIGGIVWNHVEFFRKRVPTLLKYCKVNQDYNKIQLGFLKDKIQNLGKETMNYAVQISLWIIQMLRESRIGSDNIKQDALKFRCELVNQGLQFAGQISFLIKSVTNLHIKLGVAMKKECLQSIYKLVEYLKIIKLTFDLNTQFIVHSIGFVIQYLQFQALFIVQNAEKKVVGEPSNNSKFDVLSALQITGNLLHGPGSQDRLYLTCLALNFSEPLSTFGQDFLTKLIQVMKNLKICTELQDNIEQVCNTTFLFWHQNLFAIYLKQSIEQNIDQRKITYVIDSTDDCLKNLKEIGENQYLDNLGQFQGVINKQFQENVIKKLCNYIEINLRLDFHWNLQIEKFNPFEINNQLNIVDRRGLIQLSPMHIDQNYLIVKDQVEHYLSNMFYSLTTVSLHDWKTYGEMRFLAEKKYDLNTVEDHLPTQTLEQGLDVLEIMRNINVFVSKYLYNLNNQVFIEHSSNNKHLNTINIRHIANSLRTHGTGIVNTTVNFIYQFLRKKFFTFSQFMYDEHIKSRLMKDLKYYRENFEKSNQQIYGYDRANAFNRDIKKLGVAENGQSYLDLFRQLISHIGNAMGYVRMVRSGGLNACSNASVFLPKLNQDLKFVSLSKDNKLSDATIKAAENLEHDIQNLSKNYVEGTMYFKLLVDAFTPFFQNPKNTHLKNFFIIVPPLTINFIEYILMSKDKLNKKDKNGSLFTDDGFAMGVIYILKLLDQMSDYNSLNWYKAVKEKIQNETDKIEEARRQTGSTNDEKLSQTLLLTEKRLSLFQQEFELLFYNLSSAKIFFQ